MAREINAKAQTSPAEVSTRGEIDRFLERAASSAAGNNRLIFALDATMSRQPTWDRACRLQAEMFDVVGEGDLAVQLVYFRGYRECRSSPFVTEGARLRDLMTRIDCRGGRTQIGRVLAHAASEARRSRLGALIYIGDAMEEDADALCALAGELGVAGVPIFVFQDSGDRATETVFREIARLSRGAYFKLEEGAADALRRLLRAVATFVTQGPVALEKDSSPEGRLLLAQLRGPGGTGR
ncbi:VWA domain-containing protein [Aureimonas mangrovi]|uniref:VWA domain-containing protein n=1 Tax=Aureimonas mangrovi TaxID=2758041 RepID=UPI00163D480E|nr:VWA domain-containing protein [Aureimonas mangrovi]